MDNPKAVKDVLKNSGAGYAFSSSPKSESIGGFTDVLEWINPEQVAQATVRRQNYHDKNDGVSMNMEQHHPGKRGRNRQTDW